MSVNIINITEDYAQLCNFLYEQSSKLRDEANLKIKEDYIKTVLWDTIGFPEIEQ